MSEENESSLEFIKRYLFIEVIGIMMLCCPVIYLVSFWVVGISGGYFRYAYEGPGVPVWRIFILVFWIVVGIYFIVLGSPEYRRKTERGRY